MGRIGRGSTPAAAFLLIVLATLLRALPEMDLMPWPPGPAHALASLAWAAGCLLWLSDYWPALRDPRTVSEARN